MHDARDAEDTRLLEAGEYGLLLDGYASVIIGRCRARVWPEADAIAVAGDVVIRLLAHEIWFKIEREQAERSVDVKLARACARLYSELYAVTEDDLHRNRRDAYIAAIDSMEAERAVAA
jgi:hypothetical protein